MIKIPLNDLKAAAKHTVAVADKKSVLPVLSNIKLSAHPGRGVVLWGSDMAVWIRVAISATVEKEFSVCIPAHQFGNALGVMGGEDDVTLTLNDKNLELRCGNSKFRIPTASPRDFPKQPEPIVNNTVPTAPLLAALRTSRISVCTNTGRPHLTGVNFRADERGFTATSTDGHRITIDKRECIAFHIASSIIPIKGVTEIINLIGSAGKEETCGLGVTDEYMQVDIGNASIVVRLISGKFPDVTKFAAGVSGGAHAMVSRDGFTNALKRVRAILDSGDGVDMSYGKGTLRLRAENSEEGLVEDAVSDVEIEGDLPKARACTRYLLEALSVLDAPQVRIENDGPEAPIKLTAGGTMCLVMPQRQ